MKLFKISLPVGLILISALCLAQDSSFTLQNIFLKATYQPSTISGYKPSADGLHYTVSGNDKKTGYILRFNFRTGAFVDTVFSSAWLASPYGDLLKIFAEYDLNGDETQILIATQKETIYRRSAKWVYYVYDIKTRHCWPLSEKGKQQNACFSPDGKKIAFFRDNNMFIKGVEGEERQITSDGVYNKIINGHVDWAYEEEFENEIGFFWSPDSKNLAFYRFDESEVKEMDLPKYTDVYPFDYRYKYPKAGEQNSKVSILIYNAESHKTVTVNAGNEQDQYLPRVQWTQDPAVLSFFRMNRLQNKLELLVSDLSGMSKVIYKQDDPRYIELADDIQFLKDRKHFIYGFTASGFYHLGLFSVTGDLQKDLTPGAFDVTKFYGINERTKTFYYQAATTPTERYVYATSLDGRGGSCLTPDKGTNEALFSSDFSCFIHTWSDANTPFRYNLCDGKGKRLKMLEDNSRLQQISKQQNFSTKEMISVPLEKDLSLNGWLIKPYHFDASKKYPVLMFVYGGPGSQTVNNSWDSRYLPWFQYMAAQGYVVVSVDNRGTGARGEEFKKCTYLNLGRLEVADQVAAANYFKKQSYVDSSRVGIFGWSFGGYMSSMCMTKAAPAFKTAVAVAPVTHWKFYDSIYTERYMQTPSQNPEGYVESSPITYAGKLKGNFLMIHGTADDNVHFQHSMELVKGFIKNNIQFESFYYPDKAHSINGENTRFHLFTKITDYLKKNL